METPNEPSAEILAEPPKNVLPFRPIGEAKAPVLTPVENSAFNELARQLSARLETEMLQFRGGDLKLNLAYKMMSRVVARDGTLTITSRPGQGTSIRGEVELEPRPNPA